MEPNRNHLEYVDQFVAALTDDSLPTIDFDQHREWLLQVTHDLPRVHELQQELHELRQDYIDRISGMTKAIAVAGRKPDSLQTALQYIDRLDQLPGQELIREYRRVSARFRDAFPAGYGHLKRQTGKLQAARKER